MSHYSIYLGAMVRACTAQSREGHAAAQATAGPTQPVGGIARRHDNSFVLASGSQHGLTSSQVAVTIGQHSPTAPNGAGKPSSSTGAPPPAPSWYQVKDPSKARAVATLGMTFLDVTAYYGLEVGTKNKQAKNLTWRGVYETIAARRQRSFFRNLYAGYGLKLAQVGANRVILHAGHCHIAHRLPRGMDQHVRNATAGLLVGGAAAVCLNPLSRITTVIQTSSATGRTALANVLASQGYPGLWRGLPLRLVDLPMRYGTYFCVQQGIAAAIPRQSTETRQAIANGLAGGTASVMATTVMWPLNTVRTHMMAQAHRKLGPWQAAKEIAVRVPAGATSFRALRVAAAFQAGLSAKLLKVFPAGAIHTAGMGWLLYHLTGGEVAYEADRSEPRQQPDPHHLRRGSAGRRARG